MAENIEKFIGEFAGSLRRNTFVKLTLGNYKGTDEHLQKLQVRLVKTKKGTRLFFLYRSDTRDTVKNYNFRDGISLIRKMLGIDFFNGHLFTTENDFQLDIGKLGNTRLNTAKPTIKSPPALDHDREKRVHVNKDSFYLKALGITDDSGRVRDKQQGKWRQINKFIEVLTSLVDTSSLKEKPGLSMVDMGSGKGYLTFAAYDYFKNVRGIEIGITGVDTKSELVNLCNEIAAAAEFSGLHFVEGSIADFEVGEVDILMALHACNTATDDAIFKGIRANADLIVVAPCCHQEIRPQIVPPEMFSGILKHGVMLERVAETITDGLRSLLLERSGYSTRLFEFVSIEHTPKNNMLVGTRLEKPRDFNKLEDEIQSIKTFYGIDHQRLESLLA